MAKSRPNRGAGLLSGREMTDTALPASQLRQRLMNRHTIHAIFINI